MKAADRPNLKIDSDRLWSSLMELAQIGGAEKGGVCRIALTDLDRQGRDLFVRWAKQAGCAIKVDQLGNIFARREGRDPAKPPVMTGSHLDTQPTGGKFDGAYGVMAGLEVLRVLHDSGYVTEAPIEVAVWTNEEGCRFAPAMVASGVFGGAFTLDQALTIKDRDGVSFGEALKKIGYDGKEPVGGRPVGAQIMHRLEHMGRGIRDHRDAVGRLQAPPGIPGIQRNPDHHPERRGQQYDFQKRGYGQTIQHECPQSFMHSDQKW